MRKIEIFNCFFFFKCGRPTCDNSWKKRRQVAWVITRSWVKRNIFIFPGMRTDNKTKGKNQRKKAKLFKNWDEDLGKVFLFLFCSTKPSQLFKFFPMTHKASSFSGAKNLDLENLVRRVQKGVPKKKFFSETKSQKKRKPPVMGTFSFIFLFCWILEFESQIDLRILFVWCRHAKKAISFWQDRESH